MLVAIIIYTFKDSAGDILAQIKKTSLLVVFSICISSVLYEMVEGWITWSLAKVYNPDFKYWQGVESAFYVSFYRVATLGSGAGVSAVYYFNESGVPYSQGTGFYTIEYTLHKVSIALFSGIFFLLNWGYMQGHYQKYNLALLAGFSLTFVIAIGLLLFACSKNFHKLVIWIVEKLNRKGRFTEQLEKLREQCQILEDAAATLLKRVGLIVGCVLKNFLKCVFWYGIPYLILKDFYDISLSQTLAVTSLAIMLAAVLPSPAGIGSSEVVLIMLLSLIVGTAEAGSVALLYRFATFVLPFLIGAVAVLCFHRRVRHIKESVDSSGDRI
ncbi:MAG: flippase-like domain-containing protein [Lachnospiraceae bacterium]|nr:flippase-like domain-containing protein [Lachnospiraceae bacterium]